MIIHLNEDQVEDCIDLGCQRHDAKHPSFRNKKKWNQNKYEYIGDRKVKGEYVAHITGVIGELAWSLYTGHELNRDIYEKGDDGEDFPSLEVKTLTYFGSGEPELKIPVDEFHERNYIDTYVLVRVDKSHPERIELLGKISRDVFDVIKKKKKYGARYPTNYVVKQSQMEPV